MKTKDVLCHLGEPASFAGLANLLLANGVDLRNELALPPDEFNAYIERPKEGFSLAFTDEAYFLGLNDQPLGVGELYFAGMFLYAEGKDGYAQYREEIPMDIGFSHTHEDLAQRLGAPDWQRARDDGSIAAASWDRLAPFRIHLTYSKQTKNVVQICLQKIRPH